MKTDLRRVETVEAAPCVVCGAQLDPLHVDIGLEHVPVCSFCGTPQSEQPEPMAGTTDGDLSLTFGRSSEALRGARERRGESLGDAALVTGIREKYLEELESGEANFDPYPGRVYGRYFLREYAMHLELDPRPLLDAFDTANDGDGLSFERAAPFPRPRRPRGKLIAAVAAVSILIAASVTTQRSDDLLWASRPGPYAAGARPDLAPARVSMQRSSMSGTQRGSADDVTAHATMHAPSWIEVVSDGKTRHRALEPAGSVLTFRADRALEITLGNAGGVVLRVNGERRRTGSPGEVVHLRFVADDDRPDEG
jgi:Helix-turn-helix domain/Domain of unknown function (DUF4115)